MKKLKIQIPNMQSSHCQMRVNNAINTIEGVTIDAIEPGVASITLHDLAQQGNVLAAIEKAGYTASVEMDERSDAGKTFTFRTNINCGSCVTQVAPALDSTEGVCHWDIDLTKADKILSVHSNGVSREEIIDVVEKAGFSIQNSNT